MRNVCNGDTAMSAEGTINLATLRGALSWLAERGYLSGSRSRGDFRPDSDIDVQLADRHVKVLVKVLRRQNVEWDSPFVGSVTWWPDGVQVETSFLFPRYRKGRHVQINGVTFRT
jgi:hypothetical protein